MSDIENRLLRYFVAVAEEQHFARAAERLGITPPTLTHQIKKLEGELGVRLLKRKGNTKVTITQAGQSFLAEAREALRHTEQAAAVARKAGRGELGRLELGFMNSLSAAGLLQSWMDTFQQSHTAIDITMRRLVPLAQVAAITRDELDGGFCRAPREYPSGVRGFEISRQPLVLALSSGHPLARQKKITPAMLAREAFVSTTTEFDTKFFSYTEAIARIGNFVPRVVKREDDYGAALFYVAHGYGIAVVLEHLRRTNLAKVVYRDIVAGPMPQASIAFIYGNNPSPAANLLIRHMRRHALPGGGAPSPTGSTSPKDSPKSVFRRAA
jgi:DNA-binding transcriptional LysR family regulator